MPATLAATLKAEMRKTGKSFRANANDTLRHGFAEDALRHTDAHSRLRCAIWQFASWTIARQRRQLLEQVEGSLHRGF
jgi:hypothetical protein